MCLGNQRTKISCVRVASHLHRWFVPTWLKRSRRRMILPAVRGLISRGKKTSPNTTARSGLSTRLQIDYLRCSCPFKGGFSIRLPSCNFRFKEQWSNWLPPDVWVPLQIGGVHHLWMDCGCDAMLAFQVTIEPTGWPGAEPSRPNWRSPSHSVERQI